MCQHSVRIGGGYGKTTLANYLCRDPEVRFEFTDGILRVEIGKERNDVTALIVDLIEKLDRKEGGLVSKMLRPPPSISAS
jgi:ATP-dependent protease Clp ATPase subunit